MLTSVLPMMAMAAMAMAVVAAFGAGWLMGQGSANCDNAINSHWDNHHHHWDNKHLSSSHLTRHCPTSSYQTAISCSQLHRAALYDSLTGLYNRTGWQDNAQNVVTKALQDGRTVVVGLADVDWLKRINDGLGHAAGDAALTIIANRLDLLVSPRGLAARLGGDEFALVLVGPQAAPPGWVDEAAAHLQHALCQPATLSGSRRDLSVSLGVAPATDKHNDISLCLAQADHAMYRAKHTRTAGIHPHQPTTSHPINSHTTNGRAVAVSA